MGTGTNEGRGTMRRIVAATCIAVASLAMGNAAMAGTMPHVPWARQLPPPHSQSLDLNRPHVNIGSPGPMEVAGASLTEMVRGHLPSGV